MSSFLVEENKIPFNNDHEQGIISYLKEGYGFDDIFSAGIVTISPSSLDSWSSDPKIIFGISVISEHNFFSTAVTLTQPRFILIDFTKYSIALEGISLYMDDSDWHRNYNLEVSNDLITILNQIKIECNSFPKYTWQHFSFTKTKPCRYINLSVNLNEKTNKGNDNFAIYRMEFFGEIHHTQKLLHRLNTCKKRFYINLSHFSSLYLFIVLLF